uniref:Uncharacterized protein n=1 Tax=Magallana gigas TaxID=29159 RepID=K1QGM2_MAGGI
MGFPLFEKPLARVQASPCEKMYSHAPRWPSPRASRLFVREKDKAPSPDSHYGFVLHHGHLDWTPCTCLDQQVRRSWRPPWMDGPAENKKRRATRTNLYWKLNKILTGTYER